MSLLRSTLALAVTWSISGSIHAYAEKPELPPDCTEDAMIVFDASGSMAGNEGLGIASTVTRIDKVRAALAAVLPEVTTHRRVGLITYGPGPYNKCDNVELNMRPAPDAGKTIMDAVNALVPAGRTPLTAAVEQAADVLDFERKPGTIVLVTDGEETCGGRPCETAKAVRAKAKKLTVHVIGYRTKDFSWTGGQSALDARCLAEQNGGLYVAPQTTEELIAALRKTLGCPLLTRR